jgi:hypothetical protein
LAALPSLRWTQITGNVPSTPTGLPLNTVPAGKLESTYGSLRLFGAGLAAWKASTLKTDYKRWRQERS